MVLILVVGINVSKYLQIVSAKKEFFKKRITLTLLNSNKSGIKLECSRFPFEYKLNSHFKEMKYKEGTTPWRWRQLLSGECGVWQ